MKYIILSYVLIVVYLLLLGFVAQVHFTNALRYAIFWPIYLLGHIIHWLILARQWLCINFIIALKQALKEAF